jgi:chromosome segregation ATPase
MTTLPEPSVQNGPADYDPPCPADLRDASGRQFDTDPSELAIKVMTLQAQHDHFRQEMALLERRIARATNALQSVITELSQHQDRDATSHACIRDRFDALASAINDHAHDPTDGTLFRLDSIAHNR